MPLKQMVFEGEMVTALHATMKALVFSSLLSHVLYLVNERDKVKSCHESLRDERLHLVCNLLGLLPCLINGEGLVCPRAALLP